MALDPTAIAVQGIGYTSAIIAVQGFADLPATGATVTFKGPYVTSVPVPGPTAPSYTRALQTDYTRPGYRPSKRRTTF